MFWADNCTAQNKNWTLYTALVWCVNQEWGPVAITIKYLERGHSFMRADSVHGVLGRKLKKTPNVYTFEDFVELCATSGKSFKPTVMHFDDFYHFTDGHRARQSKKVTIPTLSQIAVVTFQKGSRSLWYKSEFDGDETTEVDFLRPKFDINVIPEKKDSARGITKKKKDVILKLASSFPPAKKKFWLDLPVNDASSDLVHNDD